MTTPTLRRLAEAAQTLVDAMSEDDKLRAATAAPERQYPADDPLYIAERLCELAEWDDTPADQGDLMHQAAQKLRDLAAPEPVDPSVEHDDAMVCLYRGQLAVIAEKDAERYAYLRDKHGVDVPVQVAPGEIMRRWIGGPLLDEAIDAAIAAAKEQR